MTDTVGQARDGDVVWTDAAIESDGDRLGRRPLAKTMAAQIRSLQSWDQSVVFGLTGPWGSGKTSMINMIGEELTAAQNGWSVTHFTPWSAGDSDALIREFYQSLLQIYPPDRDTGRRVLELALAATPAVQGVPWVGKIIGNVAEKQLRDRLKEPPWHVRFKAAAEEIKKQGRPLLVVADDIDRLHADELTTLLKVVRLLGRFPGVFYLLAYDEETLFDNLRQAGIGRDDDRQQRRFMEKIVQYQFPVPPLTPTFLINEVLEQIGDAFARSGRAVKPIDSRLIELAEQLEEVLTTPRSIGRFVAHVRMELALVPSGEVDDADLAILTLIRVTYPRLYARLPFFREELTGRLKFRDQVANIGRQQPNLNFSALFEVVPEPERIVAQELLASVFPILEVPPGPAVRPVHAPASNPEYFERYFEHGVPLEDVSDAGVLLSVLTATSEVENDPAPLIKALTIGPNEGYGRVELFLRKLSAMTQPDSPSFQHPSTPSLFRTVASIYRGLDPTDASGPASTARRWLAREAVFLTSNSMHTEVVDALATLPPRDLLIIIENALGVATDAVERKHFQKVVATPLARSLFEVVLGGLLLGDEDDSSTPHYQYLKFIAENSNEVPDLSRTICEQIDDQKFTTADFAARCIVLDFTEGGDRQLYQVDYSVLTTFLGSRLPEPYEGFVDLSDLSWANRRHFASQWLHSPRNSEESELN